MIENSTSLKDIFNGWNSYQVSILHAIQPLTDEQLVWRPTENLRSAGELAGHIAFGRIGWFARMPAPLSVELNEKAQKLGDESAIATDKDEILSWLEASWQMIDATLNEWTVKDLSRTYLQEFRGKVYRISFQWTVWRILSHDMHHGGELGLLLGLQGIQVPELGDQGGHLVMPPLAGEDT